MRLLRVVYPSVLFGFGSVAIGLTVVRTNVKPWMIALLFGLTIGSLRQAIFYVFDSDTLRWSWSDALASGLGGVIALSLFEGMGLATPTHPEAVSLTILGCMSLAHFIAGAGNSSSSKLPQKS